MIDTARQHRAAAIYGIAGASSALVALAGVKSILLETTPGPVWQQEWLPGALTPANQQLAAASDWTHLIVIFAVLAASAALFNAVIGMIARANDRRYELAIHGIVGAAPARIRRSQVREACVNALLGVGFGAPLGIACALVLALIWPQRTATMHAAEYILLALAAALGVCVVAGVAMGARYKRSGWLSDALSPEARTAPSRSAEELRGLLNVAQLTGAIALTIVSVLVWSYAASAKNRSNLDGQDLYVARSHSAQYPTGIEAESIASPGALLGIGQVEKVISECKCSRGLLGTPWLTLETQMHVVSAGFFHNIGIRVLHGREFGDDAGERSVIVNRTFARNAFDKEDAIGRVILLGGLWGTRYRVVGVVEDIPSIALQSIEPTTLSATARPGHAAAIYFSSNERRLSEYDVVVRAKQPPLYAGLDFAPFSQLLKETTDPQRWFARVVLLFGALLGVIALGGAFINTLLTVETRRAEIAIRRAVGARRRDIWLMIYGAMLRTFARALLVAVLVSAALSRTFETFLPGLWWFRFDVVLGVGLLFLFALLLASLIPVREALRVSPARVHQ